VDLETQNEYRKFEGVWKQISCNADGVQETGYGGFQEIVTKFSGNNFIVTSISGEKLIEGTFLLDPLTTPKSVDWTDTYGEDAGKTFPAIYILTGNDLSFCAANENMNRPEAMEQKPGHTIRTFRRIGSEAGQSA